MNNVLEEKKAITIIGNIYETYNYELFKTLEGNRGTNKGHIKSLTSSMEEIYLISPVIVNSKMEIIDGQHRYEAAKGLGLPIRYIIDKDASLRAVQLLNAKSKDWTPTDYMESYISLGNKEYVKYKLFYEKYKFNHTSCQALLNGNSAIRGQSSASQFNEGLFVCKDYDHATKIADLVKLSGEYYAGYKRRSYIFAIAELMKNNNFDYKQFLIKLNTQRDKMFDCTSKLKYIELIEDIYNYRSRKKVNLRF